MSQAGPHHELKSLMRRLTKFLFFTVSFGLAVHLVLLSAPGIHRSFVALDRLNPGLILGAICLEAGSNLALAELYRRALAVFDRDIGFVRSLRLSMGMFTLARTLPAGGAAATVFGTAHLSHLEIEAAPAATSIVFAGVLGMMVLAAIVGLGAAGALLRGELPSGLIGPVALVLGALLFVGVAGYRVAKDASAMEKLLDGWEKLGRRFIRPDTLERIRQISRNLSATMPRIRQLGPLLIASALNWLLDVAVLWLVFLALGQRLHVGVLLVAYGVANIATALPVTPGGLGLVEAGMSSTLTAFGVPGATAVVGVLGYRLIALWLPVLAGVPQYLLASRATRPPDAAVAAAPPG